MRLAALAEEQWRQGEFVAVSAGQATCALCPAWQVPVAGLEPEAAAALVNTHLLTVHRHQLDPGYAGALSPRGAHLGRLLT